MKLRNKKTGEVIILIDHTFDKYKSLAEVMNDWEDYEPLIKDEKILSGIERKANENKS